MALKTMERFAKSGGKSKLDILKRFYCDGDKATVIDFDFAIETKSNVSKGVYYAEGYSKGFRIATYDKPEEAPKMDRGESVLAVVDLDEEKIEALAWVAKAVSTDQTRYYLNGVCFDGDKIVATDGHRLHLMQDDELTAWVGKKETLILPREALSVALSIIKETKATEAKIVLYNGLAFDFKIGESTVYGKLIDGTFPAYENVIPNNTKKTSYDAGEFAEILPDIALLTKIAGGGKPIIGVKNGDASPCGAVKSVTKVGHSIYRVKFKPDVEIGFNLKYAAEVCSGVAYYGSPSDPILIEDRRGIKKTAVLMPLRM